VVEQPPLRQWCAKQRMVFQVRGWRDREVSDATMGAAGKSGTRSAATIVESILRALAAGRLPPGSKLREDVLASHFGVSRTIVREALHELGFLGVVEVLPRRGASVVQPTTRDADELYAARIALETALIADLARHCTANDIKVLRAHQVHQRAARSQHPHHYARLLGEFHLILARLAGNSLMRRLLDQLVARTSLLSALYGSTEDHCSFDHHEAIIRHLVAGSAARAATEMRRHLRDNRNRLVFPNTPHVGGARLDLRTALAPPDTSRVTALAPTLCRTRAAPRANDGAPL